MWDSNQGSLNPKSDALSSPSDGYIHLSLSHHGFFQFTVRVEEFRLVVKAPVSFLVELQLWMVLQLFAAAKTLRNGNFFLLELILLFSICCSFFISRNLIFVG